MLNYFKKQPLVGLALAIAGCYVLSRAAWVIAVLAFGRLHDEWWSIMGWNFYSTSDVQPILVSTLLTLGLLALLAWRRIRQNKRSYRTTAPGISKSRLEVFFATNEPSPERDKVLLNQKSSSDAALAIGVMILAYAGKRAVRLRDAIKITKETYTNAPKETRRNIEYDFDKIFVEAAALCFWSVMNKYWDDDEGDFWVEADSTDLDYLEALKDALDFADSAINATTSAVPPNYLSIAVHSYQKAGSKETELVWERFTNHIRTWTLPVTTPISDPIARIIADSSLMMIREVNRNELDALCHLAYARTT